MREVMLLGTLYIDVYFLVNFTVDYLALYFAHRLIYLPIRAGRLIFASILGAVFAVADVFLPSGILYEIPLFIICIISIMAVSAPRMSIFFRIRLTLVFILTQLLLGGLVYFTYGLLDKYLLEIIGKVDSGAENRRALIFSVIILFAIGAMKLLIMILSGSKDEKSVTLKIKIGENYYSTEALVDTGNLVKDPMSMCPVVFLKRSFAGKVFPAAVLELERLDSLPYDYRRRVRLIPVTRNGETHVMTGVRADLIEIAHGGECRAVDMTLAIDREEGSFGGYFALVPGCFD